VGSLFHEAQADLFTDMTARRVGDIVIVEITENAKAKKKNDTKAERKNTFKAGVAALMGYENDFPIHKGTVADDGTRVDADFQSKHDAKAELTREDTMTASIGCTVIEVLPNRNLVIRGSREILVNGETQHIVLQGTVRPTDITTTNTVYSTQLANARIHYTGRGVLTDKQKPGWLARLLDHIWPF
jgi:flagellar L-ring protein precursor FlgH